MDHERVNIRTTSMSCGVAEIYRINEDFKGVLYALASRLYHPARGEPFAFYIFSDTAEGNSALLEKEVLANHLGTITRSPFVENPKTGNDILVFVWAINHENFKKWYSEERIRKLKKVGT